jgi:hypothetical protein
MPLLFFIDRDIVEDPLMADVDDVVLSYTFFRYAPIYYLTKLTTNWDILSRARRNSRGDLEPDAPQQVVLESQGWGDIEHAAPQSKPVEPARSATP